MGTGITEGADANKGSGAAVGAKATEGAGPPGPSPSQGALAWEHSCIHPWEGRKNKPTRPLEWDAGARGSGGINVVLFYFCLFLHVDLGLSPKYSGPNPGSFYFWVGVTLDLGRRPPLQST